MQPISIERSGLRARPERVRFIAELPIEIYQRITSELTGTPDWPRLFVMSEPREWPRGMSSVLAKYTGWHSPAEVPY